eukprot:5812131-Alexandrium_andersonii.AAC.1
MAAGFFFWCPAPCCPHFISRPERTHRTGNGRAVLGARFRRRLAARTVRRFRFHRRPPLTH